jgi:hypothetical protein
MNQLYFAARTSGISVKQPLTAEQAERLVLVEETEKAEVYFAMNGLFIISAHMPGVLFVDDPVGNSGQLAIKPRGTDTFWGISQTHYTSFSHKARILLKYEDTLLLQILHCTLISNHAEYVRAVKNIMRLSDIQDARIIDCRQTEFIRLEQQ